jgi:flagellar biosynthetic protein FliQ
MSHLAKDWRKMAGPEVLDLAREALWVLLQLSAPIMIVALVVGLVIGLLQALTQIQEMTIVFVPKIISIFVALVLLLPFMGRTMDDFMQTIAQHIIAQ